MYNLLVPYSDPNAQREYQRKWMAKRREEWFVLNGPCVDCGSWTKLELDHVDPARKVSHKVWSWSLVRRTAELAKCVVRCEDCHLKRTRQQVTLPLEHGTLRMYQYHECRCDTCKRGMRDYFRDYRARLRRLESDQRRTLIQSQVAPAKQSNSGLKLATQDSNLD